MASISNSIRCCRSPPDTKLFIIRPEDLGFGGLSSSSCASERAPTARSPRAASVAGLVVEQSWLDPSGDQFHLSIGPLLAQPFNWS
jgi:hypothetical protein